MPLSNHTISWVKVCTVKSTIDGYWYYENINEDVMFSQHRSWVYKITLDGKTVKIGESGNPLGIRTKKNNQPKLGTKCRLGRYRKGGNTDKNIRNALIKETKSNNHIVEFWAHECKETLTSVTIEGKKYTIKSQIHKELERKLLDVFRDQHGSFPILNAGRY